MIYGILTFFVRFRSLFWKIFLSKFVALVSCSWYSERFAAFKSWYTDIPDDIYDPYCFVLSNNLSNSFMKSYIFVSLGLRYFSNFSYVLKAVCVLSFKYSLFKQYMFWTPESQLISLTSSSSMDSRAFPSSVRSVAGPCSFMSMSVNVFQILILFNYASYDVQLKN